MTDRRMVKIVLKGVFKIINRTLEIIGLIELYCVDSIALVSSLGLITQLNSNIMSIGVIIIQKNIIPSYIT